ncbi:Imm51 family immunity protein [Nocardia stercoris]|uniref:Immunity protein 51 n=1 Tax=Nocardia stercoris TaxID=2483361 RepID=A0A3M2L4W7_9NOCA|nr:Imm51 family immunity protein [Nocardia stercoris]RMI32732.1 hypothetical protein EBN03_12295 [Nocardia stercoris]
MTEAANELAPLQLLETSPGKYSLILGDTAMVRRAAVFESHGHEGGGYDWDSVARTVVRLEIPAVGDRIGFDPEAGMFCAYGTDEEALRTLGARLAEVFHDPQRLAQSIAAVRDEDWD